ncbi:MAG: fructose-1,6-bisphosphatase/inositol monophosphatase family enzyme [Alphaproteobacteria bacterium]|jgi:fructose-1,6-bisphosphatase/inositol monophosphatase family enzyme
MIPDPDKVADFIKETAELDVLPRFRTLASHEIIEKAPGDIVTVADHDAEARLTRMLSALTPGALIVGEEAVHSDESLLDKLDTLDPVWILDPVDGTANFAAGRPNFAIMVAYVTQGVTRAGWIYSPVDKTMYVAMIDDGAFVDGERMRIKQPDNLAGLRGRINYGVFDEHRRPALRKRIADTFDVEKSARCAGHEFIMLAKGEADFRIYNRLWAWDHAPGALLHNEAGGVTARIDRSAYKPTERSQGLLCAPNEVLWEKIRDFMMDENDVVTS